MGLSESLAGYFLLMQSAFFTGEDFLQALWGFVSHSKFLIGIALGAFFLVLWFLLQRKSVGARRRMVSLSLPFGLGSVTYEIFENERETAWQLFVQLKTRKAALPFDTADDLIIEVLDSLYELVAITRGLLLSLPVRDSKGEQISDLMLRVLNDGLRPFLTHWQADFRRWWGFAIQTADEDKNFQEIQRSYPRYEYLIKT